MGLKTLLHQPEEETQCSIECALVKLQVVTQALWDRQQPLAHRQAARYLVAQVRSGLRHAAGVARRVGAAAFVGKGDKVFVTPLVATHPRKAGAKIYLFDLGQPS